MMEQHVFDDTQIQTFVTVTLPHPPSVNHAFYNLSGGGRGKTRAYKDWREEAGWEIKIQKAGKVTGAVAIDCRVSPVFEVKRKRDLDNFLKPLCDALVDLQLIEDDSLIVDLRIRWDQKIEQGKVVVRVTPS